MAKYKLNSCRDVWPIDEKAGNPPIGWNVWPEGKKFALILTHDVETAGGHDKSRELADLEQSMNFCSSFNFVPERYSVSPDLRKYLNTKGFEVGIHGLYHDGKLYRSREIFLERAFKINKYLEAWGSVGFRSPFMQHNLDWIHDLNIEYDASTFDTDPFEPQPDGVETIFPFWVADKSKEKGYIELPCTLPQDFTLFKLLEEQDISIWKKKLDWVVDRGGMVLVNTHPDYMNFGTSKPNMEEYPIKYYTDLLEYIKKKYERQFWHVLPRDIARFWFNNFKN
ncbi:MAG: hypothetical protein NT178_03600 [Proteobacteria bacterium]|nr:hypothetical protein [Pseudomonadota bacterium]